MTKKAVYQLSARQIFFLALASALIAVGITACLVNFGNGNWQFRDGANLALAESAPPAGISEPSVVSDEQNSIEVYKTLSPGVAFIKTSEKVSNFYGEESEQESGNGSGSVIDAQGHILTNFHVVENASKLSVSFGGDKVYPATFVGGDPDTDLAVIKIEPPKEGLTVVAFGDSDKLSVGQKVLAIGNPFGLDRTLTTGVISGLQRPIRARNGRPIDAAIQTDASINPGNSGGPLLDKYGKMIGINSQILSRSGVSAGVGFAIPVNTAKRIVPQLIQSGTVVRPKLGASLPDVADLVRRGYRMPVNQGLLIYQLIPNGSAQRAGLRAISADGTLGDIITGVDGQKITGMDDLYRLLDKKQVGETIQVEVFRDGRTQTIPVKLLPSAQSNQPTRRLQ